MCKRIEQDPRTSSNLTIRKNCIAVVSDGSAVLGLGNIGPEAAMPVMEGKAVLFKEFGGVDAFPLCIATQDPEEIIRFCQLIAPSFGAFPGIFRGALDARASTINQDMKQAAALAIAQVITDEELSRDYIVPSAFNRKVYKQVAAAVAKAARRSGVAHRIPKGIRSGA